MRFLFVILLVIGILNYSCHKNCRNYVIRDINLETVKLVTDDTLLSSYVKIDTTIVLLKFNLEYVNCKDGFTVLELAREGIETGISQIAVFDSLNENITDKFIGPRWLNNFQVTPMAGFDALFGGGVINYMPNFDTLKNNINYHKLNETAFGLQSPRLFYVSKKINWPVYFKIYYQNNDSLIKVINYKKPLLCHILTLK